MKTLSFVSEIKIIGVNPYVLVSSDQASQLQPNWRKSMPVVVQINGKPEKPWKINMMPVGDGSFYLYLHGLVRKASGTQVGDTVDVSVAFDNDYQPGPDTLPEWFATLLAGNSLATANWEKLPPSRQKEIVRYLGNLKSQEARMRNVNRVLFVLAGNTDHFMGRDWKNGK